MALTKFEKDMKIVAKLDDEPNDVGGLTPAELKEKFDEGGEALQTYLNTVLLPELEAAGVPAIVRSGDLTALKYLRLNGDRVLETSADGRTWEATGSSGHLILGGDGAALPQRSRMRFANCEVEDDGSAGPPGDSGSAGPHGTGRHPQRGPEHGADELCRRRAGGGARAGVRPGAPGSPGRAGQAGRPRPPGVPGAPGRTGSPRSSWT